jgi:hypothetical protein
VVRLRVIGISLKVHFHEILLSLVGCQTDHFVLCRRTQVVECSQNKYIILDCQYKYGCHTSYMLIEIGVITRWYSFALLGCCAYDIIFGSKPEYIAINRDIGAKDALK